MHATYIDYDRLILINGGRFDFWIRNLDYIRDFTAKHKLAPLGKEHFVMEDLLPIEPAVQQEAVMKRRLPWPPFPGGIRVAHLHLGSDIFVLTDEQWREFSSGALKGLQEKLKDARTIGFSQLMDLSESIGPLA